MKENWISNSYQNRDIEKSILVGRGIVNYKKFLFPTLDKLNNPFLLADGEKAAKRIISAVEKKEKKQENEEKEENYHRVERHYGSFQRSFRIPEKVKTDELDATYKDGILKLSLPKAEASEVKKIEVKENVKKKK